MKIFLLIFLLFSSICYAKDLVTYDKNTGQIIQINHDVNNSEIVELNKILKTDITDTIIEDNNVDINLKRVDTDKRKLKDIPQTEIDIKKQQEQLAKQKKEQNKQAGIGKLKNLGLTQEEIDALIK